MSSTAAQQLSQWIEATHPDFFSVLYSYVAQRRLAGQLARTRLRGFGDDDDTDLSDFTPDLSSVDADTTDLISSQYAPATVDIPTLTSDDLGVSPVDTAIVPATDNSLDVSSSPSFLSEVGSGISSAASSVGNFLTSAQGLGDVTKLATAYFQAQTTSTNAAIAKQVLTAQVARAAVGASPAPVQYAVNSAGQIVPVYTGVAGANLPVALQSAIASGASQYVSTPNGATGYTIPPNLIGALAGGSSLSDLLPWIALIVGGLILANEMGK